MPKLERVIVLRPFVGICHMAVCAVDDATDAEILAVCNRDNPAGTTGGWMEVCREDAEPESRRPVACSLYPERRHFLVVC